MNEIVIKNRKIGGDNPTYIIAEMSANHSGSLEHALEIVRASKEAGADCIKVQTYTPETITINCRNKHFMIDSGLWNKENLYDLYAKAYMPWEWQAKIKEEAENVGIDFLSTPFDASSVDFLEELNVDFYKIASFEIVDIPLINYVASKKKPIIMSCGMSMESEIQEAVNTILENGNKEIALLKCLSMYPASFEGMNLLTLADMRDKFGVVSGLSDHSIDNLSSIVAVSLGASIIEKHFCLDHLHPSPDNSFSLDKDQFKNLVDDIRNVEKAKGSVRYQPIDEEIASLKFRKSIFVVKDIKKGELLSVNNIKVIRPSYGMHPRNFVQVLGKVASCDIEFGTPLQEGMFHD